MGIRRLCSGDGSIGSDGQSRYPSPVTSVEALRRLKGAVETPHHELWPFSISLVDEDRLETDHILGHRQVTDVYLLAFAVENGGRFVTFDRNVPVDAVQAATGEHLVEL